MPSSRRCSALKAAGVPVFAIGVGRDSAEKDIQVGRVTAPRAVLAGTTLLLDAVVTAHGYAGQRADDGRARRRHHGRLADASRWAPTASP